MNKIIFIIICVTFLGCKSYKLYNSQKISLKVPGVETFEIEKGKMIISSQVDGNSGNFIFDTGASASLINDTVLLSDYYKKDKSKFGFLKDAQNVSVSKMNFLVNFKNGLVDASTKLFSYYKRSYSDDFDCMNNSTLVKYHGFIGLDFFNWDTDNSILMLDFTNKKLININRQTQQTLLNDGFKKVKSKFTILDQIYIYLIINNKEYKLNFDTGNTATIILPYKESKNFTNLTSYDVMGNNYFSLTGISNEKRTKYYENVNVSIEAEDYLTSIQITENLNIYNVGMGFIQAFDWIIDFKNKNIFYRKNDLDVSSKLPQIKVGVLAMKGKLKITLLGESFKHKYKVGDIISKVNNQKVTPENICEMQKLLNETKDWDALQIEIE